jgi:hypothetical protein
MEKKMESQQEMIEDIENALRQCIDDIEEAMKERHLMLVTALRQCKDKGVDDSVLTILCYECGLTYSSVFNA